MEIDNKISQSNKEIFKSLVTLSIPVILEQILSTLLQYVDTAMVGQLGEKATASVSVTSTITWLIYCLPSAIGVAVLALISRELGAKNYDNIKSLASQTLIISIACGIFLTVLCVSLAPFIPTWMGAEETIREDAVAYFTIICIPLLFRCLTAILAAALRAVKDTRTPMRISVATNLCNIGLNYVFIYILGMGVKGAAIGSCISYTAAGILTFVFFYRNEYLHFEFGKYGLKKNIIKDCFEIGGPVLITNFVSCAGYVVFARLVSSMGTMIFAAHSIAVTAETMFYIGGYGLKTATSTLVGISLGENDFKKFNVVCKLSAISTVVMMSISGLALYLISDIMMPLFTSSDEVAVLGAAMLRIVAFTEPFFGIMIMMQGIYYGLGKTKYVFVVEVIGMWLVRILFTFLCVVIWHMDLYAVWYCMIADNILKATLLAIPFLNKNRRSKMFYETWAGIRG